MHVNVDDDNSGSGTLKGVRRERFELEVLVLIGITSSVLAKHTEGACEVAHTPELVPDVAPPHARRKHHVQEPLLLLVRELLVRRAKQGGEGGRRASEGHFLLVLAQSLHLQMQRHTFQQVVLGLGGVVLFERSLA